MYLFMIFYPNRDIILYTSKITSYLEKNINLTANTGQHGAKTIDKFTYLHQKPFIPSKNITLFYTNRINT